MGRAPCCEKVGLKRGPWSPQEDQILINFIQLNGHSNWRALPKQAGLLRCGKSCRLRWTNYLRPDIKRGDFTIEEEHTIINLHQVLGNRWAAIAAKLPGRTDNEIKNVWHTRLKKRLNQNQTLKDHTQLKKKNRSRNQPPYSVIKSNNGEKVDRRTMINNDDDINDDTRLVELAFAEDFLKNLWSDEEFFESDRNLEKDYNCGMIIKGDQSPQDVDQISALSGEEFNRCGSSDTFDHHDIMDFWRSVFMRDGELPEVLQGSNI